MSVQQEAIKAAMTVARDIAEGRIATADLDAQVAVECRALFGRVAGPGDPLWELQVEVARQVLMVGGGIPANELAEWAAVEAAAQGEAAPVRELSWIEQALAAGVDDEDGDEDV